MTDLTPVRSCGLHRLAAAAGRLSALLEAKPTPAPTQKFAAEIDAFAARVEASIAKNMGGDGDTGP